MAATAAGPGHVVSLKVVVRARDLDSFIERYSHYIDGDRIFIFTKTAQQPGARIRFSLLLVTGEPLIHGEGTVTRVQPDTGDPERPPGMEVQFVPLDDRSQTLVDFLLATRAEAAAAEATAPAPERPTAAPPPPPPTPALRAAALEKRPPPLPRTASGTLESAVRLTPSPPHLPPIKSLAELAAAARRPESAVPAVVPPVRPAAAAAAPVAEPSVSVAEPSVSVAEPSVSVAEPSVSVAEPSVSVAEPSVSVAEPSVSVTRAGLPAGEPPSLAALAAPELAAPAAAAPLPAPSGSVAAPADEETPADVERSFSPMFHRSGPVPSFAEAWRHDGTAPAPPGTVPANPFGEVSDGAIEYFVEWSLEQSIGPHGDATASFSNISMALPQPEDEHGGVRAPASRVRHMGIGLAIGLPLGVAIGLAIGLAVGSGAPRSASPPAPPPPVAAAAPLDAALAVPAPPATAPALAELTVASRPPGAAVSLDGEARGTTPLALQVAPGPHTVLLSKERYAPLSSSVTAPAQLDLPLRRPTAALIVASTTLKAAVSVQGVPHGTVPLKLQLPAYESYQIEVSMKGLPPWRRSVYLKPPSVAVQAELTPPPRRK